MNIKKTIQQSVEVVVALRTIFTASFLSDAFKWSAPTFVILALFSNFCFAGYDLQVGGSLRSYPISGVAEVNGGYGFVMYGEQSTPFSGYVRLKADAITALSYNALGAGIEIFPLAILGVRAGGDVISNTKEYSAYDCSKFDCMGRYNRTYIEAEGTVGAGAFFLQGRWRRERWGAENKEGKPFVDPTSGVALINTGDSETVYTGILGMKLDDVWTVLGLFRYAEADQKVANGSFSRFPVLAIRYKYDQLTLGLGAGIYESSLKDSSFSGVAFVRWQIEPSVALK